MATTRTSAIRSPAVPSYFDILPDDLILRILAEVKKRDPTLNAVSLVSRRFHRLSRDSSLWKHLRLMAKDMDVTRGVEVLERCTMLQELVTNNEELARSAAMLCPTMKPACCEHRKAQVAPNSPDVP